MNYSKDTTIAVIGVSENPEKYGYKIFHDLLQAQYKVTGVNPRGNTILGQKIYASLKEIPILPELVLVVVPPKIGILVLKDAAKLGIKHFWLQPGAESDEIISFAQTNNIHITHHACFMSEQGIW